MAINQQAIKRSDKWLIRAILIGEVLLLAPWVGFASLAVMAFDSGFSWWAVAAVVPIWSYPILIIVFGIASSMARRSGNEQRAILYALMPVALPVACFALLYVVSMVASVTPSKAYFEIRSEMEEKCELAQLKIYAQPEKIDGLFIDKGVLQLEYSNMIGGVWLETRGTQASLKTLMADGVFDFYENHNSIHRSPEAGKIYRRIQSKDYGTRTPATLSGEIQSDYGLFLQRFESTKIDKNRIAGGTLILLDLKSGKTIAETSYYASPRVKFFCGDTIDGDFSGLTFVKHVFQDVDPLQALAGEAPTPFHSPGENSRCAILPERVGCLDPEKEARALLKEAVAQWKADDFKSADTLFDSITAYFPDTQMAAKTGAVRKLLQDRYKDEFSVEKARLDNKGEFSSQVVRSLDEYYETNRKYPKYLTSLELYPRQKNLEYLKACRYLRAQREHGYQLDCKAAEELLSTYRAALRTKYLPAKVVNNLKVLSDFPKGSSSWGEQYNPAREFPQQGYLARYVDLAWPKRVAFREVVDSVQIDYSGDRFHNIMPAGFQGYWAGKINFDKNQIKKLTFTQSHGKTRLYIDDRLVFHGYGHKEIFLDLEQGEHRIEIEYDNGWHSIQYSFAISDVDTAIDADNMSDYLADFISGKFNIHYVGMNESSDSSQSTVLNIAASTEDIVLVLSSQKRVNWFLSNPYQANIKAIIYGSLDLGSTVSGDVTADTLLLPLNTQISSYQLTQRCQCDEGHYHCDGGLSKVSRAVNRLTGASLTGFSGKRAALSLEVPEIIVDKEVWKNHITHPDKIREQRNECIKQRSASG